MSYERLRLAVIVGSGRKGRTGSVVSRWFVDQAVRRGDLDVDVVDVADFVLPGEPSSDLSPETATVLGSLSLRLARSDMFVIITPEYNRSFPASLKALIDWHFTEWQAKPVGFVSYGGMSGGLRAVEQLCQVFIELHAVPVRDTVSFHRVWELFDRDDRPRDPEGCGRAAAVLLDRLCWWGVALREAREKRPFRVTNQQIHPVR